MRNPRYYRDRVTTQRDKITLMRGRTPVMSFLGTLGSSLRETRLTAMIGYLISHYPKPWEEFLQLKEPVSAVVVEADYQLDRADVLVETPTEQIIIEAKVTPIDPKEQVNKYFGHRKYLFTNFIPPPNHFSKTVFYVSWDKFEQFLNNHVVKSTKPYIKHLAKELILYMREHQLVRSQDSVEIYARELNDELTVSTFLKCHIYACWLEKGGGKIAKALYFAPHFGQKIAREHPGVYSGISYVAKIEALETVDTWQSFLAAAKRQRGSRWLKKHRVILKQLRNAWGSWNEKNPRNFAFLATPRLAFNPPINKDLLQKGKGWLSRRTFSFDELFDAWGRSGSAKIK